MIATISPCESSYLETINTLRYASRAKNIKNRPTINLDYNDDLIKEYQNELEQLTNETPINESKKFNEDSLDHLNIFKKDENINYMNNMSNVF